MYDISSPEYKTVTHFNEGDNSDIIKVLENNFYPALKQAGVIAKNLHGDTFEDSCYNVWKYLKNDITYKADGVVHQKILLPVRLVADGVGDCKSFALFSASVLGAMGYKVGFCYASYSASSIPTHVYCIAEYHGKKILIDGVWHSFNSEKKFTHKKIHWMKISTLSGVGDLENVPTEKIREKINFWVGRLDNYLPGSSERMKIRERIIQLRNIYRERTGTDIGKTKAGQVLAVGKKVSLSPGRNAFLGLIKINARGIATRLSNALSKNPSGLEKMWATKLGGSFKSLKKAIEIGKGKKPFLGAKNVKGVSGPELVALALPVIASISKFLKGIKGDKGEVDGSLIEDGIDAGGDASLNLDSSDVQITDKNKGADHDESGFSLSPKVLMLGGAGLLALIFLPKMMK